MPVQKENDWDGRELKPVKAMWLLCVLQVRLGARSRKRYGWHWALHTDSQVSEPKSHFLKANFSIPIASHKPDCFQMAE
jgi:hypothetical protein